jgi:hypothetical protein
MMATCQKVIIFEGDSTSQIWDNLSNKLRKTIHYKPSEGGGTEGIHETNRQKDRERRRILLTTEYQLAFSYMQRNCES